VQPHVGGAREVRGVVIVGAVVRALGPGGEGAAEVDVGAGDGTSSSSTAEAGIPKAEGAAGGWRESR